ncbi:MAG: type I methionyl aminopeptidase [Spirochaetaceae bacterium]|nr:MAG: type I methionyl aminopeptidase [Spirochaetaceae bacterium]
MIKLKTPEQIEKIRKASQLVAQVLGELEKAVAPGVSTVELDALARQLIEERDGRPAFLGYMGFPGAICASVNEAVIHGIPDKKPLVSGDVVSIDCGIEFDGYYGDSAVTVPVGKIHAEVQQLLDITRESLYLGIEQARPGNRINDISEAIYRHVKKHNYGVVRPYCGHGVGIDIHEDPQVPNYVGRGPNPRLKVGMVIAIEPMVNLGVDEVDLLSDEWTVVTRDRRASAHFEHTVAIRESGPDILSVCDN